MFWLRYYFNIEFNSKDRIVSTLGKSNLFHWILNIELYGLLLSEKVCP
jgi:hypothetical protein